MFWVGRMVMLGTQLTGQLPFSKVRTLVPQMSVLLLVPKPFC